MRKFRLQKISAFSKVKKAVGGEVGIEARACWYHHCAFHKASLGNTVYTFQIDTIPFVSKESRNRVFIKQIIIAYVKAKT